MSIEQFIQNFQQNYTRINNYLGNNSTQLMMSLATKYTLNNQSFSGVALYKIMESINENKKRSFSFHMETTISYKLAAQIFEYGHIESTIEKLIENDHLLQKVGFKKSPLRAIGALLLQDEQHAAKAKQLFDQLKQKQRILTSNEDIPYVLLLTANDTTHTAELAETVLHYYKQLRDHSFSIGNHLQALAQIMTLYSPTYNEQFLQYVILLRDEIEKHHVKVTKIHYPLIGLLAITATDTSTITEIARLHNRLIEEKLFKWNKRYALIIAIQKVVKELTVVQNVVDMTPLSTIDQLIMTIDYIDDIVTFIPVNFSDVSDFFN